jgi:hypothetical protein
MRMSQEYAYDRNIHLNQEYEFESGIYTCQEYTLKSGICDCKEYALRSGRCRRSLVSGICIGVRFMNVSEECTPYVVWTCVVKGTVSKDFNSLFFFEQLLLSPTGMPIKGFYLR